MHSAALEGDERGEASLCLKNMETLRAGTYLVLYQLTIGGNSETSDARSRLVFHEMKEEEGPFKLHLLLDAQNKGSFQFKCSVQREKGVREEQTGRKREREQGSELGLGGVSSLFCVAVLLLGSAFWQLLRGKLPAERQAAQDDGFRLHFILRNSSRNPQNNCSGVKMFHFLEPAWC